MNCKCSDSQYIDSSDNCNGIILKKYANYLACDINCLTCAFNQTFCTSCPINSNRFFENNFCPCDEEGYLEINQV